MGLDLNINVEIPGRPPPRTVLTLVCQSKPGVRVHSRRDLDGELLDLVPVASPLAL